MFAFSRCARRPQFQLSAWLCFSPGLLMLISLSSAVAADWPQHLGPARNGISAEQGLLQSWPVGGPSEVWRVAGGVGSSGLAIAGNRLVTMVQRGGKQLVVALDANSGQQYWEALLGPSYENPQGNGPRGTPTVAGERVYAFSGDGILLALELADGKTAWRHDTLQQHRGRPTDYGMACSPLVVGELVIVTVGAPGVTVVAYDCESGKTVWTAGQNDLAGYSSPVLLNVGGKDQTVIFTGGAAMGLASDSGDVLWRYPYITEFGCNIATPLAVDGGVFLSAGENHGSVLLSLKPSGATFDITEVWESLGPKSVLRNEWQTSILLGDFLFGMDNVGGAGPITHLTCIEAATGKRQWRERRYGKGNLIAADGKLFISTLRGELVVARVNRKKYDEIGRKTILGSTRQAPALANGLLYLRDNAEIVCLDVRER